MGQKVNPRVMRIGMSEQWRSRWFNERDFAHFLRQDVMIRKFLNSKLKESGIDRIDIERSRGEITVTVVAAKPGIIIGRGGTGIDELRKAMTKTLVDPKTILKLNVQEVENVNLSAGAVVQACATDIERRIPFRRVMKQNIDKVMKAGAQGVKIGMAGRLNGAEIARREVLTQGKVPLHTLRANIDYSRGKAQTTYGVIGIKVWIYKGLYFPTVDKAAVAKKQPEPQAQPKKRGRTPRS